MQIINLNLYFPQTKLDCAIEPAINNSYDIDNREYVLGDSHSSTAFIHVKWEIFYSGRKLQYGLDDRFGKQTAISSPTLKSCNSPRLIIPMTIIT